MKVNWIIEKISIIIKYVLTSLGHSLSNPFYWVPIPDFNREYDGTML